MERLKERYEMLSNALATLEEAIRFFHEVDENHKYFVALRNSLIKSFEYSQDTFWKFLKEYLEDIHGAEPIGSPKAIFRKCLELGIITPAELEIALAIAEDRNMTTHTYNEILAETISEEIPQYYQTMQTITNRLSKQLK